MDARVKVLEEIDHSVYLTEHQDISGKQDVISDLEEIRSNAELAKTALKAIPEEYVTETELEGKGYLTANDFEFANNNDIDSLFNVEAWVDKCTSKFVLVSASFITVGSLTIIASTPISSNLHK